MAPNTPQNHPVNYLVNGQTPEKKEEEFYEFQKLMKMNYGQVWGPETHMRRRKMILQKHPEVAKLLGADKPYSIILAIILVILGLAVCYLVKDSSWPVFLLIAYVVGGTISHTCHVLIHDFTHFCGHPNVNVNKLMAIWCNIAMGIPSAISFGKHHSDHHNFLGEYKKDPDLPLNFEAAWIGKSSILKFIYWWCITLVYALRPMFFYRVGLNRDEYINLIFIICTDAIIYKVWGANAVLYLLTCAYFSIGPHPASAHILAEHYEFVTGQETYDYLGPWNIINLNIGYHLEHHDFPTCPWYNLKKVREAAPQFYEPLPCHTSYFKVIYKFLFDFNFNLYNRTHRVMKEL